ncbi:protein translocase subunit SecD [Elusimicrobiota bacterium]
MKNLQIRLTIIIVAVLVSIGFLVPSALWYLKSPDERVALEKDKKIPKWLIRLGLDLRGGTHLLMELDTKNLEADTEGKLGIEDAMDRAVEVIRNRVDQFGVTEPFIAKQGERFIVIQLPGISDPRRAKELIGKTALLEFRIADDSQKATDAINSIRELGDPYDKNGDIKEEALKLLPKGTELFTTRARDEYHILKSTPELTGRYLINAKVEFGQFSYPNVSFVLNSDGAKLFARTTANNVGKTMAIILDGVVQSAPSIRERIPGGRGIIEGTFSMEQAHDLALILRAGALPAPVKIVEERTVGPTLGEDSIRKGMISLVFAFVFVAVFMLMYYRVSGAVSVFCLVLNLIVIMSGLALFSATLTLPGLAGIALTVGMAIDANVLIFERIREEIRLGKSIRVCLDMGYQKAIGTIVDANLTTLIAAFFLFQFGSGPIKGFAVTLTIGILASMFTAVFVSRSLFMTYYETHRQAKRISI